MRLYRLCVAFFCSLSRRFQSSITTAACTGGGIAIRGEKSQAVTSTLQIDVSYPEWLSGSSEILYYEGEDYIYQMSCYLRERGRKRRDWHLNLMELYTISISSRILSHGALWDKVGIQAAVVWALLAAACISCWCVTALQYLCQGSTAGIWGEKLCWGLNFSWKTNSEENDRTVSKCFQVRVMKNLPPLTW